MTIKSKLNGEQLMDAFELASGSVRGRDHFISGKNNQDALYIIETPEFIVGVVSDGCGDQDSLHSEVGAKLAVKFVARYISRNIGYLKHLHPSEYWYFFNPLESALLTMLNTESWYIEGYGTYEFKGLEDEKATQRSRKRSIIDYFLFTLVGIVITAKRTVFFSMGDGVISINNELIVLESEQNTPPYIAYKLIESSIDPSLLRFNLISIIQTEDLSSFMIATDGINSFIKAGGLKVPGKEELVGPLYQFWTRDSYFSNPDALRRKLSVVNRDTQKIDWESRMVEKFSGLLHDDTTLIVGRLRKNMGDG